MKSLLLLCTIAQELGSNLMNVPWKCPSEPTWQHCRNEWEVILWSNLQRELTAVQLYWPWYCTSRGLQILHTINLEIQLLNSQTAVSQNPLVHLASSDLSLDTVRRWHVQISQVKCFITNTRHKCTPGFSSLTITVFTRAFTPLLSLTVMMSIIDWYWFGW